MKSSLQILLAIFLLTLCHSSGNAQASLEFNQVLLTGNSQQTVPTGHVWKLESVLSSAESMQDSAYTILINGNPVYVSQYASGDRYWDNIQSITWETRKNGGASCSNTSTQAMRYEISGYEKNLPFTGESYTWQYTPNAYPTTWTQMFTITPQNSSYPLSIYGMSFGGPYNVRIPDQVEFRMTVNYRDGTTQVRNYGPFSFGCCGCGGGGPWYLFGDNSSLFEFPATQKDYYFLPTRLPVWLPAGTTVQIGSNVRDISVIEFKVTP